MSEPFYFICYSSLDLASAIKLADQLTKGPPSIAVWLDKRDIQPGIDWDKQIGEALSNCAGVLYLMSEDSVTDTSECQQEWKRALTYKKPIVPLLFEKPAIVPYRLATRQYIDFTGDFRVGLAKLRDHVRWRGTPEGALHALKERLEDAKRDLKRASEGEEARILEEIGELKQQIERQQVIIANPDVATQKTKARVESALEREREPPEPVLAKSVTKFINRPPSTAPSWFQDRYVETGLVADFLKDSGLRMMTVVGRAGVGKTVMVCRLLKALEAGHLPDDLGPLSVDGVVYLSPKGLRQVTLPHLYADLCKLLPPKTGEFLDAVYRNPQATAGAKMQAVLEALPHGRTAVLLDNFEEVVDSKTGKLHDQELEEALRALLELPAHGVKVIITTRVAPRVLLLTQPGRQSLLTLDEGLESPYAENILRLMDADRKLGLRDAPQALLATARERTWGYPRALEALYAILATDRSTTLEEVLADAARLLPENVVEALVGEAFSRLDPLAQQVMQALAALAAPVPEAAVDYLLQPYVPGIDSAPVLRRLVNMLFARRESGRFHLHQADRSYALERIPKGRSADREASPPLFTRFALLHRAGEYYQSIRTPRASWKVIDDLAPQLAEFEVRIAGEEYDAAASVLREIGFDYLLLWGHVRLAAELYERLEGHLTDRELMQRSCTTLGNCYDSLGDYPRAIDHHQQSLAIAREIGYRQAEGNALGNLGNCYYSLGDYPRAIDHHQQSLAIAREIGDRQGEGGALGGLGNCYDSLGDYRRAIDHYERRLAIARETGYRYGEGVALACLGDVYMVTGGLVQACKCFQEASKIADATGNRQIQHEARFGLAHARLYADDLRAARETIDGVRQYDYPQNTAAAWTATGIIRLRQGEPVAASKAFACGLAEADRLLEHCGQNFSALDTKGLARCGLALCEDEGHLTAAEEAFRAARKITQAKGVVARVLSQFDALALADKDGILSPARKAAEDQ